ncbi:MAG: ATP-binding protein [Candidatus Hinthialibacter antarcticus]|nr:ATP-binding protein [Candidatus Hinthialibacter antarcticus]
MDAAQIHEVDERERMLFRLLLVNKWFIIPTTVAYEWILSTSAFRSAIYHFVTPTIIYTAVSLLFVLMLWMSHRRDSEGRLKNRHTIAWLNGLSLGADASFVFFLIFVPDAGNYLWFLFLQPMAVMLLAPRFKKFTQLLLDSVFGGVIVIAIYGLLSSYQSPTGAPKYIFSDMLLSLAGLFYMWVSARVFHVWIDALNRQCHALARRNDFWTDIQQQFPVKFFIVDDKGKLEVASEAARQIIELPKSKVDDWPEATQSIRNALLLRFHAETPMDEMITLPDDDRPETVQILPTFLGLQNKRYCIALISERDPKQPPAAGIMRSDRLTIAGQIAAGLAHELGNPLGIIRSCAAYVRQKADEDDPNREELELIETETTRCQNMIDRLLSLASPKRDTPAHHDLRDILQSSTALVKYQAGTRIIETSLPKQAVPIFVNEGQLTAVFVNLLLNALQSMEQAPLDAKLRVHMRVRGAEAIIDVTDEGSGIAKEELDKIFDPFFTKKASGTGLGLSIVHQIIYSMNGRIEVASTEGAGTTFTVHLPLEESDAL